MSTKQTIKEKALNYVEAQNRPCSWKEIQKFLLKEKGLDPNDPKHRGWYSSYFSADGGYDKYMLYQNLGFNWEKIQRYLNGLDVSERNNTTHGHLRYPTKKDNRYLDKNSDGLYVLKTV